MPRSPLSRVDLRHPKSGAVLQNRKPSFQNMEEEPMDRLGSDVDRLRCYRPSRPSDNSRRSLSTKNASEICSGSSVVMLQPTRRFPLGPQKPTSLLRAHALVDGGFGELPKPGCFTRRAPVPSAPIALLLDVCNRRGRRIFLRLNRTT